MTSRQTAVLRFLLAMLVVALVTTAVIALYVLATPDYQCTGTARMECKWR